MAKRNDDIAAGASDPSGSTVDSMEQKVLAFAEQLGRIVGTVQVKAEGWLDCDALRAQISGVRDSASKLLDQLGGGSVEGRIASLRLHEEHQRFDGQRIGASEHQGRRGSQDPCQGEGRVQGPGVGDEWCRQHEEWRHGPQRRRRGRPREEAPPGDAERIGRNRRSARRRLADREAQDRPRDSKAPRLTREAVSKRCSLKPAVEMPAHSDPSARATSTLRSSPDPDTRTLHGLQQTSQSCTKLPFTSGSR